VSALESLAGTVSLSTHFSATDEAGVPPVSALLLESGAALVRLLSLVHDRLLLRHQSRTVSSSATSPPYPVALLGNLALALGALRAIELPLELWAHYLSPTTTAAANPTPTSSRTWSRFTRLFALLEAAKAVIRLAMLLRVRGRLLVHADLPGRDEMQLDKASLAAAAAGVVSKELVPLPAQRRSVGRPSLADRLREESGQRSEARSALDTARDTDGSSFLHGVHSKWRWQTTVAELLYIVRPLVYLGTVSRYGERSWRPWLASASIDLASYQLAAYTPPLAAPRTKVERAELRRRQLSWLFYLLRSPAFNLLRPKLPTSPPLPLSLLPGSQYLYDVIVEYIVGYREYYAYLNAS
jgi:peroxin-16